MQPPPPPLAEDNEDDGDHELRNHRTIDQLTRDHANKMLAVYDYAVKWSAYERIIKGRPYCDLSFCASITAKASVPPPCVPGTWFPA